MVRNSKRNKGFFQPRNEDYLGPERLVRLKLFEKLAPSWNSNLACPLCQPIRFQRPYRAAIIGLTNKMLHLFVL